MLQYYILCFVLLTVPIVLLFRLDLIGKTRRQKKSEKRKKNAQYKTPTKLQSRLLRWSAESKDLRDQNRVSTGAYIVMLLSCSVGGYVAGRVVFASMLLSVFVAVISLALPAVLLSFKLNRQMLLRSEKLNADMMILSNSYMVTHDIITSVESNLDLLEISKPYRDFLTYITYFDSDVESGLRRMENEVGNAYFSQWVDTLVMAQKDRSLIYASISVVESMRDSLMAQRESSVAMAAVWRDYFTVLALIFASPLIIRTMMPEAYGLMTTSLIGQLIMFLLIIAVAYSVVQALRINRPLAI